MQSQAIARALILFPLLTSGCLFVLCGCGGGEAPRTTGRQLVETEEDKETARRSAAGYPDYSRKPKR